MRAPEIAHDQAGAFSRAQARACGMARDTIIRRLARRDWVAVVPDVFVTAGTPITEHTRAWAGHLATGGVVAGRTAAALHGIAEEDDEIHVISRRSVHVNAPGVRDHRVRLASDEVMTRDGLPTTTRLRTLTDLLATEPAAAATSLLFRAVQQNWISRDDLERQIARRRGMTGNTQLRRLAELLGTGAHSPAERELHRILSTIPGLVARANIGLVVSGTRVVVDVLLPDHRIVIEVDGRRFHSDSQQFTRDRRRQNLLIGAGYAVLRFTWIDVVERTRDVRQTIETAIEVSSVANTRRTGP